LAIRFLVEGQASGGSGILGPDYFREMAAVLKAAAGGPPTAQRCSK
jgi:hypothetical protein